jgi:hypothetical protein
MKVVGSDWWSVFGFRRLGVCCLLLAAFCLPACSVPNLEEPDCRESRDVIREFYSFHFGNDMHPSSENIKLREKFLTTRLTDELLRSSPGNVDYFTGTSDFPKAFRVGECKINVPGESVTFDVLLFWKDDTRTQQSHIPVELKKDGAGWRVDKVN